MQQIAACHKLRDALDDFERTRQYGGPDPALFRRPRCEEPPQQKNRNDWDRTEHDGSRTRHFPADLQKPTDRHSASIISFASGTNKTAREARQGSVKVL